MARSRPGLEKAIRDLLQQHGAGEKPLSYRQAERLTGLSAAAISELAKGNARRAETLCRFAVGLGEDPTRLLILAGFDPDEPNRSDRPGEPDPELRCLLDQYAAAFSRLPGSSVRAIWREKLRHEVELLELLGQSEKSEE